MRPNGWALRRQRRDDGCFASPAIDRWPLREARQLARRNRVGGGPSNLPVLIRQPPGRGHPRVPGGGVAVGRTVLAPAYAPRRCRLVHRVLRRCDGARSGPPVRVPDDRGRGSRRVEPRLRGIMLDVTERKHAEEELRRSEARYRSLVTATSQSIWTVDAQGKAYQDAPWWRALSGQAIEEIADDGWLDVVHPEDRERVRRSWNQSVTNGIPYTEEYRIRPRHGAERIVTVSGVPVRDDSGQIVEWIGTYSDVTEHRETSAKLAQAQKMESLGRLAGGVAHDFNNLLTVISGYGDFLVTDREPDDPVRQDAEEIRKAAARAALLTQQLLAFSRKQMRAPELIELNPRVGEASNMLERLIGENIELVLELSPAAGTVMVDVSQVDQLLMNLVVNARDAMPDGGVVVIRTDRVVIADHDSPLPRGDWTTLVVSDTGIGMSAEVRARAFEPFFTTKQTGCGTGLGLSTVYGIVRQSGGHVTLDSQPGRGTVVTVSLPRVGSSAEKPPPPSPEA